MASGFASLACRLTVGGARWPWGGIAATVPALVVLGVFLHYYADFVSDDAFISFRYADHLASGRGLEWNPGERVEGYSNFLWVALIALLQLGGIAPPEGARLLSWLAAGATVVLVGLVSIRGVERPSLLLAALAPLPLVLGFPYQHWSAMRLETPLFGLLLLLSVYLFEREEQSHAGPRWPSAIAYLALALTRPEGAAFVIIPLFSLLYRLRRGARLGWLVRERLVWGGILVGGFLIYNIWRLVYFGDLLPNTYHAKVAGGDPLLLGWGYLKHFVVARPLLPLMFVAALLLGGALSRLGVSLLACAALVATLVVLEGGDWMREWRMLVPATPLVAAALGHGVQLTLAAAGWRQQRAQRLALVVGLALLGLVVQVNMGTPWVEWARAWKGERRDVLVNLEGELVQASRDVAAWLHLNAAPDDLVAVNHAGALPYYSGLPTLDMVGLNDRHIARLPGRRHGKWDASYVLARKPAFIVLNTRHPPSDGRYVPGYWPGETALFEHRDFARHYQSISKHWSWRHRSIHARNEPGGHDTSYIMVFRRVGSEEPRSATQR